MQDPFEKETASPSEPLDRYLIKDPIYGTIAEDEDDDYQAIFDDTFSLWYLLAEGASLPDAVRALTKDPDYRPTSSYAIRIEDRQQLLEDEGFLELCTAQSITVILGDADDRYRFFNLNENRPYMIVSEAVFAAWDRLTLSLVPLEREAPEGS